MPRFMRRRYSRRQGGEAIQICDLGEVEQSSQRRLMGAPHGSIADLENTTLVDVSRSR